jgi:pimeloyl-ACP methyl ester carboxylesterase
MPKVTSNGIQIEYDTFGDRSSPPLLLIMGFGGQMILWDPEFCRQLAEAGLYVIRFDNRDVGLSSKLEGMRAPELGEIFAAARRGEAIEAPYTLEDMSDDAIGLLDGLGLQQAHVCGA